MKKIMFNDKYALTAAVLNGWKTQTRRIVPDKLLLKYGHNKHNDRRDDIIRDAPFIVGEEVAVAMAYKGFYGDFKEPLRTELVDSAGFFNKMFVRADLMPHQIEITNIRVQRLQDISNEDCLAEGITTKIEGKYEVGNGYGWDTTIEREERDTFLTPRAAYAELIDKISGKGTWAKNPWVYCYTFKLIK